MNRGPQVSMALPLTPMVKWLLIVNVGIWLVFQVLVEGFFKVPFTNFLSLVPARVIFEFRVWELFTYMFLHSMQLTHILFNMLMLWFFGAELEQRWGGKYFLFFYLFTGIGAAVIYCLGMGVYAAATGSQAGLMIPVLGASGAVFGLMLAQGILFGERIIYFFMLFPMKMRYFVMIMGAVQIGSMLTSGVSGGEVAYLAHLGGLASGYVALLLMSRWKNYENFKKSKKKGRNLRLVVDNENPKKSDNGPRYWN
ncbi:rhomboid family intramembrane serine protease [Bdellovibrio sp. HCB337]|uniref:rhomboid family intramembrane serine protease n=1 Tax=Bdellovibrio sp. HCB337 TaxID=3394358 RepID=UPI0039A47211